MGTELFDPKAFSKPPSQAFAGLNPEADSLADGIGQGYAVIGYKGKVWTIRHRGEKKVFVRPDDGTPAAYLDVVVLTQAKNKSKSYYLKWDPNSENAGERPICASLDGVVPDEDVQQKQAESCSLCPRNVWRTDHNGRKTRECTDYKRLAVLVMPVQTKPIFGEPLMEPAFLRIPPASLNNLATLGEQMARQGYHYATYIMRITFDPNESHPKMMFRALQGLTDAEAPVILKLREDPQCERIIGANTVGRMQTLPATGNAFPPSITAVAQPVQETVSDYDPSVSAPLATIIGDLTGTTITSPAEKPMEEAFGGVTPAPQASPSGEPDESDADLDARIAALMPKG